ncbi:MAG: hypothetical protein A2038_15405 [Deltaproteobacteria bacterium GWA2_57_13]|nr:MAG: hypothetical protein A2038_15405 [Deltaproteobacteria bacterium GWA2_57_13]
MRKFFKIWKKTTRYSSLKYQFFYKFRALAVADSLINQPIAWRLIIFGPAYFEYSTLIRGMV